LQIASQVKIVTIQTDIHPWQPDYTTMGSNGGVAETVSQKGSVDHLLSAPNSSPL